MHNLSGKRQIRVSPWGKLPACLSRKNRKLEAYAAVRNQLLLASARPLRLIDGEIASRRETVDRTVRSPHNQDGAKEAKARIWGGWPCTRTP